MVLDFSNFKTFFNKKLLIQVYFILFILLNIIDFLNIIPNDLDFFKKLLSWTLIGYVFYKVSISKILIGERIKSYDSGFIFAFSLMSIVKSLVLYVRTQLDNDLNLISSSSFPIFHYILNLFPHTSNFVILCFIIGFILTLILTISLLVNYEVKENSFLGSFNFQNEYFKHLFNYVLGFIFVIFFALIVFNFFMEWFALAVDALILVIGIIYYTFIYISKHMTNKISYMLSDISNSGNQFYYNLIEKFSDKKTFFIGVSFLLCIHFLVDIGVYLIPYLLGTHNALYFESLSAAGRSHYSLFGIFNFQNSLLFKDLISISGDWMLGLEIILIYILNYFLVFSLMFLPFYLFYKNVNKQSFKFKKVFSILFLSALFFNLVLFFLPTVNTPLNIGTPNVMSIKGVDFYTNQISIGINSIEILSSIFILLIILLFLLFRYDKYKIFFDKIILLFVLIFFIYYIFLFFTSSVQEEWRGFKSNFENNVIINNEVDFIEYENIYLNESLYKPSRVKIGYKDDISGTEATMIPFSNLKSIDNVYVEYKENHNDYLFIEVNKINLNKKISFKDFNKVYFKENIYDLSNQVFFKNNFSFIYYLGENYFTLDIIEGKYKVNLNLEENDLNNIFQNVNDNNFLMNKIQEVLAILRLVFSGMFYIFGTIAFSWFFIRNNLLLD